jgi:glycosyltransferase involved in cell wall biosynthesis
MRYAWLPETDERLDGVRGSTLRTLRGRFRRIDLAASRRPDGYVAISTAVAERVERFYGRTAAVVHPPVDVDDFDATLPKDPKCFLWAHRLVPYKQPELVAEAFRGLPYRLVMVGVGPLEERLRQRTPANVELRGWLPREQLARLYATASGFIHVGEEDFGITMVEALASGTPVIAVNRGGARDIVRNKEDGILLDRVDVDTLRAAIRRLAETPWERSALVARAHEFSRDRFATGLRSFIASLGT